MKRDELLELRRETIARAERMRGVGDYAAGASDIRENCEALLRIIDHLLEKAK